MLTMTFVTLVLVILILWVLFSLLMRRTYNGGEDLISQLPDDVLVRIISFTPTTTAVATSILSKRWRNLYKSLSSFELDCRDLVPRMRYFPHPHPHDSYSDFELIINNLERFLRLCSGSKIHNFDLRGCYIKPRDKRFELCIYYLGKSSVEELSLSPSCCCCCLRMRPRISCHLVCELPSLKYLQLRVCTLQPYWKWKWRSKLNYSLQTLDLTFCTLAPGFVECIFSNCMSLQSVRIYNCDCPPKLCIRGQLKTLNIRICEGLEEIELCAGNLNRFEFLSYIGMVNLVFDNVPQLEILYIGVKSRNSADWIDIMGYVFGELRKHLSGLKFLTFGTEADLSQPPHQEEMWMGMGRFGKLKVLDITVNGTTGSNLLMLIPYLETCPLLEELQLNLWMDDDDSEEEEELQLNLWMGDDDEEGEVEVAVGAGVERKVGVRKVEISGFGGTDNEIEFALWMLKSAVGLLEMRIIRCYKLCYGHRDLETCSRSPWSKLTLQTIKRRLVGQAVSATANLIILHQSPIPT